MSYKTVIFNRNDDVYLAELSDFDEQEQNTLDEIATMTGLLIRNGTSEFSKYDLYKINIFPSIRIVTFHCGNIDDLLCASFNNNTGWWNVETFNEWDAKQGPGQPIPANFFDD